MLNAVSVITEPGYRDVTIQRSGLAEWRVQSPGCAPVLGMTLSATIGRARGLAEILRNFLRKQTVEKNVIFQSSARIEPGPPAP